MILKRVSFFLISVCLFSCSSSFKSQRTGIMKEEFKDVYVVVDLQPVLSDFEKNFMRELQSEFEQRNIKVRIVKARSLGTEFFNPLSRAKESGKDVMLHITHGYENEVKKSPPKALFGSGKNPGPDAFSKKNLSYPFEFTLFEISSNKKIWIGKVKLKESSSIYNQHISIKTSATSKEKMAEDLVTMLFAQLKKDGIISN